MRNDTGIYPNPSKGAAVVAGGEEKRKTKGKSKAEEKIVLTGTGGNMGEKLAAPRYGGSLRR